MTTTHEKIQMVEQLLSIYDSIPDGLFKQRSAHHRDEQLIVLKSLYEDLAEESAAN